jgi:hypothetical protein
LGRRRVAAIISIFLLVPCVIARQLSSGLIEIEQFRVLFSDTNFKLCGNMAAVMARADGKAAALYACQRSGSAWRMERALTLY